MRSEVLVLLHIFAFLRACRLHRLCARFLGFSGWWVSFGVLHASVQVIVDCTGLMTLKQTFTVYGFKYFGRPERFA